MTWSSVIKGFPQKNEDGEQHLAQYFGTFFSEYRMAFNIGI